MEGSARCPLVKCPHCQHLLAESGTGRMRVHILPFWREDATNELKNCPGVGQPELEIEK